MLASAWPWPRGFQQGSSFARLYAPAEPISRWAGLQKLTADLWDFCFRVAPVVVGGTLSLGRKNADGGRLIPLTTANSSES